MTKSHENRDHSALYRLYSTSKSDGLPPFIDQLYPAYMPSLHYMGDANSCPNGAAGIRYGMWDPDDMEKVRVIEWGAPLTPVPVALYRLRDEQQRLLYVGITEDLEARWISHAATKSRWPDVATRSIEWRPTREHALVAEAETIRAERPLYNVQHNKRAA